MKNLIFEFDALSDKARAVKAAIKAFVREGMSVVSSEVAPTTMRRSGITFRNVFFTFADGQTVMLSIKSTGDVFEVRINGKVTPMKNQDDHGKAINEIVNKLTTSRAAFQRALAKVRVPTPPAARVSRATLLKAKEQKRDDLIEAVSLATAELKSLAGEPAA